MDYTLCFNNEQCSRRKECFRAMETSSHYQSLAMFYNPHKECEHFIPRTREIVPELLTECPVKKADVFEKKDYSCYFRGIIHKTGDDSFEENGCETLEMGLIYNPSVDGFVFGAEEEFDLIGLLGTLDFPELNQYKVDSFIEVCGVYRIHFPGGTNENGELHEPIIDVIGFEHQEIPESVLE